MTRTACRPASATANSPNDAPGNSATASGNIPFTPGADPVTIELSVGNGGDTGLKTLAGQTVLAAWDAASSTLIGYIAGTDPSDAVEPGLQDDGDRPRRPAPSPSTC